MFVANKNIMPNNSCVNSPVIAINEKHLKDMGAHSARN